MRYVQLRAFHTVATQGGFTRAATVLRLSQPAVSDQISRLEREYDVLLFYRRKKQVTLTKEGQELFEVTRQFFEIEARAQDILDQSQRQHRGKLRIMADSASHVAGVLSHFRQKYPHVELELTSGNTSDVIRSLREYKAEIGVLGIELDAPEFTSIVLGVSPIVAFVAKDFPAEIPKRCSLKELAQYPLILREAESHTQKILEHNASKTGVKISPAVVAEGRESVREIVAAGGGIGFVSEAEFGQDARLRKIKIDAPSMEMTETLNCLHQRQELRPIKNFLQMAKSTVSG